MSQENSLTTSVHAYISTTLAKLILDANTPRRIGQTAGDIRAFLTDPTTLSTPAFVICRYLQACHPGLLEQYGELPNLVSSDKNVPWPAGVLTSLAGKLKELSREQGAAIKASEWNRYLTGSVPIKREKAFQIAFSLKMDVPQTLKLLLAFGMEPYSVRNPLDMICLFCQKLPGTYTWAQAWEMYEEFLRRRVSRAGTAIAQTKGMTEQIQLTLDRIFEEKLQSANARQALIQYMVDHSAEFTGYLDKNKEAKEVFLPGFSLNRIDRYKRLQEYLAVLYPHILTAGNKKCGIGDERGWDRKQWDNKTEYVADPVTGEISLTALVRAMFWASGWTSLEWKRDAHPGSFDDNMRIFCERYQSHIDKVNRFLCGGRNVAFFDRRDALLFIFFLISAYIKLLEYQDDEAEAKLSRLRDMADSASAFDQTVGQVFDKLEMLDDIGDNASRHFQSLCQCFDMLLTRMGYSNLYLPAQFDRFVLLALLAEDPGELASLIMSEAEWESYDIPFPNPLPRR